MITASIILIIILTTISFLGGLIFPLGIVFIFIALLCSFGISIIYIIILVKDKKFNLLIYSFIPILVAGVIGCIIEIKRTEKVEKELIKIRDYVASYYTNNGVLPEENNIFFNTYDNKVKIEDEENGRYIIYYYDAIIMSDDDSVHFRPRP